jgi:ferredoxin/flavodoxin---NADP+ reductase
VDVMVYGGEADLDAFDPTGESARLAAEDRHVRGNYAVIREWADRRPTGNRRRLFVRFWLRPTELHGPSQVSGLTLERTRLDDNGRFIGTGSYDTLDAQMVLRSVGYQSVPLAGVPFDDRSSVVPNAEGRVVGPGGAPLPGEYVAGWLKRGPTGVIGTNKSDAAETVRGLLADLAGGPGPEDVQLPRAGLLRYPEAEPGTAAASRFEEVLAERGIQPVSYADWLRIEAAERELAATLGRGARVKLPSRADIHRACGLAARS